MGRLKISDKLFEYKPYIQAAAGLIPLQKVRQIRTGKSKDKYLDGCYFESRGLIIIYNIEERTLEDILHILAHELAHIVHFEHTPEHFRLMSELMTLFSLVMVQYGVMQYAD